jgi:hypothetical protein
VTHSGGFIDTEQNVFYAFDPPYLKYLNIIDKLVKLLSCNKMGNNFVPCYQNDNNICDYLIHGLGLKKTLKFL